MEGSEGVVKAGQVLRGKRYMFQVRGSPESAPENELNPFLVEPVLARLLKLVKSVTELKELRKMCQTWDEFNLKEIEDRAFNGKIRAIDFLWTNFPTKLVQFLGDTQAIPRLFSSFRFNFPQCWNILQNRMKFFSIYPIAFVHLGIPRYLANQEQIGALLRKLLESKIWGNLKGIFISTYTIDKKDAEFDLPDSSLFIPSANPNMMHNLEKLEIEGDSPLISELFETELASGKYTNLRSIKLAILSNGNLDFSGLDTLKLTRIEIGHIGRDGRETAPKDALKFTSDLIKLTGNGMKLKNFGLNLNLKPSFWANYDEIFFQNLPLICSNLTQFLSSQSSNLKTLNFGFISYKVQNEPVNMPEGAEIWAKIHLPQFEVLHSLKLQINFKLIEANSNKTHSVLLAMSQNLNVHFPKLVNLTLIDGSSVDALRVNPPPDEVEELQLKRLELLYNYDNPVGWNTSFEGVIRSVEELHCPAKVLYGERLPWAESLRQLHISDINIGLRNKLFKLNYLKRLKSLSAKYYGIEKGQISVGFYQRRFNLKVEDYLATFKEATQLSLKSISFMGQNMGEALEKEFIRYFPLPVEFKNA